MTTRNFSHAIPAALLLVASLLLAPSAFASVPPSRNVEWEHISKVLSDQRLPLDWKDSEGHSRVFYHMQYGTDQDAVALVKLAREKQVRVPDRDSLAYHCILYGKEFLLRELLASGVSPNARSGKESLLMMAAREEQLGIMRQLIKAGADVNYEAQSTSPPKTTLDALSYALETGKYNAARLLFDSGYDLSKRRPDRITALFFSAIAGGHPRAVRYFLERYKLLDNYSTEGETPLTYAVRGERNDWAVSELLTMGADPCKRNKAGMSVEDILREQDRGREVYDRKYTQIRRQLICQKTQR